MKLPLKSTIIGIFLFFLLFFFSLLFEQRLVTVNIAASTSLMLLIGLMFLAGVLDGFNPCAFSTLLLWSGFLLNRFGNEIENTRDIKRKQRNILNFALYYAFGILFIYFLLGVGTLELFQLTSRQTTATLSQIAGLIVVVLGVIMLRDSLLTHTKAIIKMPAFLHPIYKKYSEPTTKLASFFSGIVVGLCSVPCGGAIYMAILILLNSEPFSVKYPLLLVYNVGFILPVVVLALTLSNKKLLQSVSRDFISFKSNLKILIGIMTILLGLFSIYIA